MSVVYCHNCDTHIDTDYNVEHFVEGTEDCALNELGEDTDALVQQIF